MPYVNHLKTPCFLLLWIIFNIACVEYCNAAPKISQFYSHTPITPTSPTNKLAYTISQANEDDWKKTLLGPSGVLTEIFNLVNEKRKEGLEKLLKENANPTPPLPQGNPNPGVDFTKILESFVARTPSGDFAEPVPDLGICDRVSCAEIYSAMDEFRKSEMFSNFQTAVSLIHDPKGWDIIGELLANPELIESYVASGAEKKGNSKTDVASRKAVGMNSKNFGEIKSTDGNLGVDFSHLVDQKPIKVDKNGGDGGLTDYYSAIDDKNDEEFIPAKTEFLATTTKKPDFKNFSSISDNKSKFNGSKIESLLLPDFAESIDEFPDEVDSFSVNKPDEQIISKSLNLTERTAKVQNRFFTATRISMPSFRTYSTPKYTKTTTQIKTTKYTTPLTTTRPTPRPTTKRNFRKDNDYYAMYYDQN